MNWDYDKERIHTIKWEKPSNKHISSKKSMGYIPKEIRLSLKSYSVQYRDKAILQLHS